MQSQTISVDLEYGKVAFTVYISESHEAPNKLLNLLGLELMQEDESLHFVPTSSLTASVADPATENKPAALINAGMFFLIGSNAMLPLGSLCYIATTALFHYWHLIGRSIKRAADAPCGFPLLLSMSEHDFAHSNAVLLNELMDAIRQHLNRTLPDPIEDPEPTTAYSNDDDENATG